MSSFFSVSLSLITVALATGIMSAPDSNFTLAFHEHLILLCLEFILIYFLLHSEITEMPRETHGGFIFLGGLQ